MGRHRGPVGSTVIACREHKNAHEVDVLALARGSRPRTPKSSIAFIGEAKHRDRRPGIAELRRLEHIRELLTDAGHDAGEAVLGLFSATGFTGDLQEQAAQDNGKLLVSLEDLYGSGQRA